MNLLLVEDDVLLGRSLAGLLRKEGYDTVLADSVKSALAELEMGSYALILLDVRLPDGNGVDLCRQIRIWVDTPVIFLTACDEEADMVRGLDAGADDYITKPFGSTVLLSRIRAVLRRTGSAQNMVITTGDISIHPHLNMVSHGDREILLTPTEYTLLTALIHNVGRVLTRDALLQYGWDMGGEFIEDNTLSVHIRRLRQKLGDEAEEPVYIKTVRGTGYRWLPPVHKGGGQP